MSTHRKEHEPGKARVAVAGVLTAGALLIAPVAVTLAAPAGIANAGPETPGGGNPPVDGETPGGGNSPGTTPQKRIIRLPFVKIEIKNTRGDHKPPKIKVVPFPRLHRTPPAGGSGCANPTPTDGGNGGDCEGPGGSGGVGGGGNA